MQIRAGPGRAGPGLAGLILVAPSAPRSASVADGCQSRPSRPGLDRLGPGPARDEGPLRIAAEVRPHTPGGPWSLYEAVQGLNI